MKKTMSYHITVSGEGYVYAFKRAKKTDDLEAIKNALREDPFGASDYAVQGPGMEADIVIADEDGEEVMNDIVDACNFCDDVSSDKEPSDLSEDEVLVTYFKPVRGEYVDEDFEAPAELDDTGSCSNGDGEDIGVGGEYITSQLRGGVYLFTKMNFGDHQFNILKPEGECGPQIRIKTSDGAPYFVSEGPYRKFYPMDDDLKELIERHHDAFYPEDDEEADTCDAEEDIDLFISNLDMDELEQVEDSDADGLYIDSAEDRYYSLVKDGRILLSFESVD